MKKVILLLVVILFVLPSMTKSQDKKDSIDREIKTDTALQRTLLNKLTEKEKSNSWEWGVPLTTSIVLSLVALWFSWRTYSRDKKYKDLEFIAEVDKLLLEHPELWAYEDAKRKQYESSVEVITPSSIKITGTEKLFFKDSFDCLITALSKDVSVTTGSGDEQIISAGSQVPINGKTSTQLIIENDAKVDILSGNSVILQSLNDKLLDHKIEAFLYYKLNNFEMALKQQNDKSARECWEEYLVYLYKKSTPFNKIIQDIAGPDYGDIYDQDFVREIMLTLIKKGCNIQIAASRKEKLKIK